MRTITRIYRAGVPRVSVVELDCGHKTTHETAAIKQWQWFIGKTGMACPTCNQAGAAPPSRQTYTVIGLRDETGEVFADHVEATDAHDAMSTVSAGDCPPSQILGAIVGKHSLTAACEDSGKAAYYEDLLRNREGNQ